VLFLALIPLVWLSHPIPAHGSGGEAAAGAH
jgi:hypothetical protein